MGDADAQNVGGRTPIWRTVTWRTAMQDVTDLSLVLAPGLEVDLETYDRLTRQLQAELAGLEVKSVDLVESHHPDQPRPGNPINPSTLLVAVSSSGEAITAVTKTVVSWLGRQPVQHRVVLTVDGESVQLENPTAAEQQQLLDAFIQRHSTQD
jgi:hypothetical protein